MLTMRAGSGYFSPNSIIAPAARASVERHELPFDRLGGGDLLGHVALDRGELLGFDGRRIAEVEPQPVFLDLGAHLVGVLAERLLQGVMQDVRRRVRPANALPPRPDRRGP